MPRSTNFGNVQAGVGLGGTNPDGSRYNLQFNTTPLNNNNHVPAGGPVPGGGGLANDGVTGIEPGRVAGDARSTLIKDPLDLAAESRPNGVYQNEIRLVGSDKSSGSQSVVIFKATPDIEENGTSMYVTVDNITAPASILFWLGSPSRTFSINAKLVSRTVAEANDNLDYVNILRAWRMPLVGGISGGDANAPETLRLWGYDSAATVGHFVGIPCVLTSLNLTFNSDTDYITTSSGVNMPIIMPVSIQLREAHTTDDLDAFNYQSYKAGTLQGWT